MAVVIVTGSCGLIGSETVSFFCKTGFEVVGIDNNMRRVFFGKDGSVLWNMRRLRRLHKKYTHHTLDIRDRDKINRLFRRLGKEVALIVHTAAQPSHDWAARDPMTDFSVNATGTLVLLEATRHFCPQAVFIFTSTNKVYGNRPNDLPLIELEKRYELPGGHPYYPGINESMSIDTCLHSVFGASKVAADVLTQEYGRYFGLKTGVFRGGCLTGPAHSGAELHGFLSYLVRCAITGRKYLIYGYKGKQVRDNIHSYDLVNAFYHFFQNPHPAEVYNIGGSRFAHVSILEAIEFCQQLTKRKFSYEYNPQPRIGDHLWWISDVSKFQSHYPEWNYTHGIQDTLREIYEAQKAVVEEK